VKFVPNQWIIHNGWNCFRWNLLRNPQILRRALNFVYADRSVVNDKLVRNMVEATEHPAAFAAFASIVFAPRAHSDFGENLIRFLLNLIMWFSLAKLVKMLFVSPL